MKKIVSCLLVATLALIDVPFLQAAEKKDVSDPVLREMIAALSTKMPRFIDKYGATVFVADEQITRASLITALYEYDKKKSSASTAGATVSKQELDALNTKIASLEKKLASSKGTTASSATGGKVDIVELMNDLEPNMPMLLDNSLANSKVFKDLQKQVNAKSGGSASVSSTQLAGVQTDIDNLNKKYNELVTSLSTPQKDGTSKSSLAQVNASISVLQKEVAGLNVKMSGLQNSMTDSNKSVNLDSVNKDIAALKTKVANIDSSLTTAKDGKMSSTQLVASVNSMQKDISSIQSRLAVIDSASSKSASSKSSASSNDVAVINRELSDIKAKISSLDTTVALMKNSKGSASASASSKDIEELKKTLVQTQKSYVDVAKRVNTLEDKSRYMSKASSGGSVSNAQMDYLESRIDSIKKTVEDIPSNEYVKSQISKSNTKTSSDIKRIENRLNDLERGKTGSSSSKSDSGSSSAGTITKISLGITMVAALFIAR